MKEDKKHKKRMEGVFEELRKYDFKYSNTETILRILYWHNPKKLVRDKMICADMKEDFNRDIIKNLEKDAEKGYIGRRNSLHYPSRYDKFYFNYLKGKIPERLILALYLGTPMWKEGKPYGRLNGKDRVILYQNNQVDLKKAVELFKWRMELEGKFDKHAAWFDTKWGSNMPLFDDTEYQKKRPYQDLEELMK